MAFISIEHITAGYQDRKIISDISFNMPSHSITCIMGVNGCGKSTLLKSISCQLKHHGVSFVDGKKLEDLSIKELAKLVSYVPQKSGIEISLPALDVVLMGFNTELAIFESPKQKHIDMAIQALEEVGLSEYIYHDYLCLSEGQKQLVLLARTLIENTKLLLLDEPDSALDFQNRYSMLNKLRTIIDKEEKSAVLCLHDINLALYFSDQIVLIDNGHVYDILYPKRDDVAYMEEKLSRLFGNIQVVSIQDKSGNKHLCMLWENEI